MVSVHKTEGIRMKLKHIKEKPFLSGYNLGIAATRLSIQLLELRISKKVLREEVAKATGVPIDIVVGLEQAELKTFLNLNYLTLAKLAEYFNVTLDVKFLPIAVPGVKRSNKTDTVLEDLDISSKDRV